MTVVKDLSKRKLDLVGVQEVRCEDSGTEPAGGYTFSGEREMRITNLEQGFLAIRESYQQLRGLRLIGIACHK
jgi:hypothetical protein